MKKKLLKSITYATVTAINMLIFITYATYKAINMLIWIIVFIEFVQKIK